MAAWTSTGLSASLCTDACTAQEVVIVEPLTFSVLFSLVCCSALAPWCSEACTTQLVVIVEPLMFSVLFSSRSPQLVVIVELLMASVLFSCVLSLVRLAPLLAALHGRRLGTYLASRACRHCASRADSLSRRCLLLYWPCSSKLRRALSDFERPLPFTPSSWLLLLGILSDESRVFWSSGRVHREPSEAPSKSELGGWEGAGRPHFYSHRRQGTAQPRAAQGGCLVRRLHIAYERVQPLVVGLRVARRVG